MKGLERFVHYCLKHSKESNDFFYDSFDFPFLVKFRCNLTGKVGDIYTFFRLDLSDVERGSSINSLVVSCNQFDELFNGNYELFFARIFDWISASVIIYKSFIRGGKEFAEQVMESVCKRLCNTFCRGFFND